MVCTGDKFFKIRVPRLTKSGFYHIFFVILAKPNQVFSLNIRKIIAIRCIFDASTKTLLGAVHKVRTYNLPKKQHFLLPNSTPTCAYQGLRNVTLSVNFVYVLYRQPLTVCNTYSYFRKEIRQKKSFFTLVVGTYCSLKCTNCKTQVILSNVTKMSKTLITIKAEFIAGNVNQS